MRSDKPSISQATSVGEIGEFWDTHDLADHWNETEPVEFEVDPQSAATYYPLERGLATKLRSIARRQGVSTETLLNLWIQKQMREEAGAG